MHRSISHCETHRSMTIDPIVSIELVEISDLLFILWHTHSYWPNRWSIPYHVVWALNFLISSLTFVLVFIVPVAVTAVVCPRLSELNRTVSWAEFTVRHKFRQLQPSRPPNNTKKLITTIHLYLLHLCFILLSPVVVLFPSWICLSVEEWFCFHFFDFIRFDSIRSP